MTNNNMFTLDSLNIEVDSKDITTKSVDLKETQSLLDGNGNLTKSKIKISMADPLCHDRMPEVFPQLLEDVCSTLASLPLTKPTKPFNESSPRGVRSQQSLKGMIQELKSKGGDKTSGKGLGESPINQLCSGKITPECVDESFSYKQDESPFSSPLSPDREATLKAAKLFVTSQKMTANSSAQPIPAECCVAGCSTLKHAGMISFEDHTKVSPNVRSPLSARLRPGISLHASNPSFATSSRVTDANVLAKLHPTHSLISVSHTSTSTQRPSTGASATLAVAPYSSSSFSSSSFSSSSSTTPQPLVDAQHKLLPEETQPASSLPQQESSSPHPVKPLTTTASQGEKKGGRSVLEKLKSSIHPGRSAQQTLAEAEDETQKKIEEALAESSAQYEQLTNMELISLLLQQDMDMEQQQADSVQQGALLLKHEAELKKVKAQVRDLEDYIDKLLVQIMEQTPTLLQVRTRHK
ncbi:hypothetical protein DPEC_G00017710 [Dallia pectoralis]|uniref:Uncharacterized protein n=1 Tax=Dallia pectoralis TaxID=75939 RepID=A0ACC2HF63_DALPE|nr:hypothetical protein DPEC_G00017710 [Dallia pectoralis]